MSSRLTLKRVLTGAFACALAAGALLPAAVSAASPAITFDVRYGDECLNGRTTNLSDIAVKWRDAMGNLKASETLATTNGYWELCLTDGYLAVGDKIHADDGSFVRDYVVPDFTVVADRVTNTFHGNGPAGRTIRLGYPAGLFADYTYDHTLRVGMDGTWQYDPNDIGDITGGLFAYINWRSPNDDTLEADTSAPTVTLHLGSAHFLGATTPNTSASLALLDAGTSATLATATVNSAPQYGDFSGTFRKSGHNVKVMAGQHFSAPSLALDADWIVPNITASADKMADTVSGRCYDTGVSAGAFMVRVMRTGHTRGFALGGVQDGAGNFTADFSDRPAPFYDPANIKSGDNIVVSCMQTTGDWVEMDFRVP